jgi:hypothetical protein
MNLLNSLISLITAFYLSAVVLSFPVCHFSSRADSPGGSVCKAVNVNQWQQATVTDDSIFAAVRKGDINSVRELINRGIDLNRTDENGWTPLDYARKNNRQEIRMLLQQYGALTFPKSIPAMRDGPHVRLIDSATAEIYYLEHDAQSGRSYRTGDTIRIDNFPQVINGVTVRREDFFMGYNPRKPVSSYYGAAKIFVVGDMHGECARTAEMLKKNGIMDNEGNWTWGKGHLVFMGDIFDRGNEVTEALWMIFRLERQAAEHGGKVHLILGNHEPMIFNNDLRYVTDEYYSLCDNLGLNYSDLYDAGSLMGAWLRQKPAMIMINDYAFVHAGFSPALIDRALPADTINYLVWRYLNNREYERDSELRQLIMGGTGVLWYRGMADENTRKDVIDKSYVVKCLDFYNIDALVIGHTEVDSIKYYFGGRIIDVNIPKRELTIPEQGLLIKKHNFSVVYQDGKEKKLARIRGYRYAE